MKNIILVSGPSATVDDADYDVLIQVPRWHVANGYARYYAGRDNSGHRRYIYMHNAIMGKPKHGKVVDHVDCDRLNNQRANLRVVSRSLNGMNRKNRSPSQGVSKSDKLHSKPWRAYISNRTIGYFNTKEEAVEARLSAESMVK